MVQGTGFILLMLFVACTSQRFSSPCPESWDIKPCVCGGYPGAARLTCDAPLDSNTLKKMLTSVGKLTFRDITLHNTNVNELQSDFFTPHVVFLFFLNNNTIEKVDNGAFKGSEESAQVIRLDRNKISSFSFAALSGMKNLNILQLNRNELTAVEELPEMADLRFLDLSYNKIASIGKGSFAHLPQLERLDLSNNEITSLGERALSIDNHKQSIQINLANNSISQIDNATFSGLKAPLIDLSNNKLTTLEESVFGQLCEDGAEIIVENNPFDCNAPSMTWLKKLPFTTKQRLTGLSCADGTSLDELKLRVALPESIWDRK